jgi:hypothetical protein
MNGRRLLKRFLSNPEQERSMRTAIRMMVGGAKYGI